MVKEAIAINEKNRNTLLQDDIKKEMENMQIIFQFIPVGDKPHNDHQYVNCHMVFNIQIENF